MPESTPGSEVIALATACDRDLGHPALWVEPDGYPTSLALCIIDSIYSTGAHYSSVRNVVDRYRAYRSHQGGNADTDGADQLRTTFDELGGPTQWAAAVGNHRRTSTAESAPLKSAAILEIIDAFSRLGVKTSAELRAADKVRGAAERSWLSVPGQRSGITWEYALMLAQVPGAKAGRMVTRYVSRLIGVPEDLLNVVDAAQLLKQASDINGCNLIHLARAIWRYESGRPLNQDGDPEATASPEDHATPLDDAQAPHRPKRNQS